MMGVINGLFTLLLIVLFIAICIWAWSKHNVEKFEKMAHLPLEEDAQNAHHNVREVKS